MEIVVTIADAPRVDGQWAEGALVEGPNHALRREHVVLHGRHGPDRRQPGDRIPGHEPVEGIEPTT